MRSCSQADQFRGPLRDVHPTPSDRSSSIRSQIRGIITQYTEATVSRSYSSESVRSSCQITLSASQDVPASDHGVRAADYTRA
jgi:hypothetical protein